MRPVLPRRPGARTAGGRAHAALKAAGGVITPLDAYRDVLVEEPLTQPGDAAGRASPGKPQSRTPWKPRRRPNQTTPKLPHRVTRAPRLRNLACATRPHLGSWSWKMRRTRDG